ncbi:hypothetical protein V2I01_05165 [Micromonospora sp. BRA006-A]|nr:hypothetical protein [Micromonospora sp. BRA006-A]
MYADGAFRDKADDLEATMKIDGNASDQKRGGWWDTKSHLDNWYNDNQKAANAAMAPLPAAVEPSAPSWPYPSTRTTSATATGATRVFPVGRTRWWPARRRHARRRYARWWHARRRPDAVHRQHRHRWWHARWRPTPPRVVRRRPAGRRLLHPADHRGIPSSVAPRLGHTGVRQRPGRRGRARHGHRRWERSASGPAASAVARWTERRWRRLRRRWRRPGLGRWDRRRWDRRGRRHGSGRPARHGRRR